MTPSKRQWVIPAVIVSVLAVLLLPFLARGAMRWYALHRYFSKVPGAKERVAIKPIKRNFSTAAPVHLVDLGYATFDTGSTNAISIEAVGSGASLYLTNGDVQMVFLPPYRPGEKSTQDLPHISSKQIRTYPHTHRYLWLVATNFLAGEMEMEEACPRSLMDVCSMSSDDFLLHSTQIGCKGAFQWGANEVQFFESPNAKGIVRIGKNKSDRQFAGVFFTSPDGKKGVGSQLTVGASEDVSKVLDSVLSSFRFTVDTIPDRDGIRELIEKAGIPKRKNIESSEE